MLILQELGKNGLFAIDKDTGKRKFLPYYIVDEEYSVFEHKSPKGPQGDKTILIPSKELVQA